MRARRLVVSPPDATSSRARGAALALKNVSCTNHSDSADEEGFAMWQPFTEEHQQFRKTVRAFAEKELAPHVEE